MIKLLHGDCYKLIKDIPDKSIDLVIIDPPYEYTTGGCGKNQTGEYLGFKKGLDKLLGVK